MTNKHHVLTHRHLILKDKQCILRFAHQGIIYSHHITVRLMLRQLWRSIHDAYSSFDDAYINNVMLI